MISGGSGVLPKELRGEEDLRQKWEGGEESGLEAGMVSAIVPAGSRRRGWEGAAGAKDQADSGGDYWRHMRIITAPIRTQQYSLSVAARQ
ncbi:hypothetical protein KC346_g3131 [Hortaea werneckii]|nr:hypothetical protein KC346_g3131 [Hortaea werneckii]